MTKDILDNSIKNPARKAKQFQNNLTNEQVEEYNTFLFLHQRGAISSKEFEKLIKSKGLY